MENPKERPHITGTGKKPETGGGVGSPEGLQMRLGELYVGFVKSQQDLQQAGLKAVVEPQRTYASALRSLSEDLQNRYRDAYNSYYQRLQEAARQSDYLARLNDLNHEFTLTLEGLQDEAQKRLEELNHRYASDVYEAQKAAQNSYKEAYRNYLRGQQEAWASLDVNALVGA